MCIPVGTVVKWTSDVPPTWRFIYTPGPMVVRDSFYHSGEASEYAKKFDPEGMKIKSGWIYVVEYPTKGIDYYNPPLSLLWGEKITKMVHELWLEKDED